MRIAVSIVGSCVAAMIGCGGTPSDRAAPGSSMMSSDLASPLCVDPRADAWSLPLKKASKGGLFNVSLVAGDPSPPTVGVETWTLQVDDETGTPMSNVAITTKPWMPDMGHGTSVVARTTAALSPGSYTITPLYFFMPGFWQTTFTLQGASSTDTVTFSFCLAGGSDI